MLKWTAFRFLQPPKTSWHCWTSRKSRRTNPRSPRCKAPRTGTQSRGDVNFRLYWVSDTLHRKALVFLYFALLQNFAKVRQIQVFIRPCVYYLCRHFEFRRGCPLIFGFGLSLGDSGEELSDGSGDDSSRFRVGRFVPAPVGATRQLKTRPHGVGLAGTRLAIRQDSGIVPEIEREIIITPSKVLWLYRNVPKLTSYCGISIELYSQI